MFLLLIPQLNFFCKKYADLIYKRYILLPDKLGGQTNFKMKGGIYYKPIVRSGRYLNSMLFIAKGGAK